MKLKIILTILKGYVAGCAFSALSLNFLSGGYDLGIFLLGFLAALLAPIILTRNFVEPEVVALYGVEVVLSIILIVVGAKKEMPKLFLIVLFLVVLAITAITGYYSTEVAFVC